jgi:hypothetical protein
VIERVSFRLVSPLVTSGADQNVFDPSWVLRPPSLRGVLRFWTRALAPNEAEAKRWDAELWGTTATGQGITIVGAPRLWKPDGVKLFPHKGWQPTPAVRHDAPRAHDIELRFRIPATAPEEARERLQAVVWTWLHLGAVGRRARRGYGSLMWVPRPGDLLEQGYASLTAEHLGSKAAFEGYLRTGLAHVATIWGGCPSVAARAPAGYFRLGSIDQVFVGEPLKKEYDGQIDGMEHRLHGLRNRGGSYHHGRQLGEAGRTTRLASPMALRVMPLAGNHRGYLPILTWGCQLGVTSVMPDTPLASYLAGLGFSASLSGRAL